MNTIIANALGMEFSILFLVLCVLAFLAGVSLNGYMLFITGFRVERTVSAVWFLNQALSDFIFIAFLPLRCTSIFLLDSEWAERLSSAIISVHLFSSAFLLTALSVHRCILVERPAWAQNHCIPRLAVWVVLGMWALSFGFGLRCSDLWEYVLPPARIWARLQQQKEWLKAAVAMQFLVGFLIPLALILIPTFYILLAAKLRRNRLSQSTKPLKILLGLVPNFLICWLPYHILCLLLISDAFPSPPWIKGSVFVSVLTYFNSCLNPIFYLTMEDEFLRYRQCARNPQTADNSGPEPAE
ncbi:chemerin-like receptor 1 [Emydura macquarii macquarii]|uniref:chemerin-like receptor 1 n=1 Tax=Emydura macquarii macquarii TaxID=1129001 RepID=UPI00352AD46A